MGHWERILGKVDALDTTANMLHQGHASDRCEGAVRTRHMISWHDPEDQYLATLSREPSPQELQAVKRFFARFATTQPAPEPERQRGRRGARRGQRGARAPTAAPAVDRRHLAWSTFCQSLFASAEFRFLN